MSTYISQYVVAVTNPTGFIYHWNVYTPYTYLDIQAQKRNWLCNWKDYKTAYEFKNHLWEFYAWENDGRDCATNLCRTSNSTLVYQSESLPDYYSLEEEYSYRLKKYYGDAITGEDDFVQDFMNNDMGFHKLHIEVSSRGIGANWLIFDYNN